MCRPNMGIRGAKGKGRLLPRLGRLIVAAMRIFLCLVAMLAWAGPALARLPVADRAISRSSDRLKMDVHFPVTGRPALDTVLADYARARIQEVGEPPPDLTHGVPYTLLVSYKVTRNDDRFFAVLFTVEEYTGGAHPMHGQESFHFLMPDGRRVYLPELVDGMSGLSLLSRLSIADLDKHLLGPDGISNADWIRDGAAPAQIAATPFEWNPSALVLHFGDYAVAPYVAGPQSVRLPMAAIASVVRPDPRAPAPSFDCAKAAGNVEKALCADAGLARLDWQVALAYARKRDQEKAPKARAALLAGQRTFLAARDRSCASGNEVCLSKAYQRRLAALEPSP